MNFSSWELHCTGDGSVVVDAPIADSFWENRWDTLPWGGLFVIETLHIGGFVVVKAAVNVVKTPNITTSMQNALFLRDSAMVGVMTGVSELTMDRHHGADGPVHTVRN